MKSLEESPPRAGGCGGDQGKFASGKEEGPTQHKEGTSSQEQADLVFRYHHLHPSPTLILQNSGTRRETDHSPGTDFRISTQTSSKPKELFFLKLHF